MSIVARGLGQPESVLVAAGMGATEQAAPGAMSANLAGSGSLTGSLVAGQQEIVPPLFGGGGRSVPPVAPKKLRPKFAAMSATLTGSSVTFGSLTGVIVPVTDDEFNTQILLLLEGVTA